MRPSWLRGPSAETAAASAAIAAGAREPHQRAPAPNRRVRPRVARHADIDVDAPGYEGGDEDDVERVRAGDTTTARQQRMLRQFEAWEKRRPRATSDLLIGAVAADGFRDEIRRLTQEKLQEMINWAAERHCCYSRGLTPDLPVVVGRRTIIVQDLTTWYSVEVPTLDCSICGRWEVQAEECGCFPASPRDPQLWLLLSVLDFYHNLLMTGGQSAGGAPRATPGRNPTVLLLIPARTRKRRLR